MMQTMKFSERYGLVRAVEDLIKRQTRRIMEPQPAGRLVELYDDTGTTCARFSCGVELRARYKVGEVVEIPRTDGGDTLRVRITEVWCMRMKDITDRDCIAEGVQVLDDFFYFIDHRTDQVHKYPTPRKAFQGLIGCIYDPDTWRRNPWVWAYEFKKENKQQL